MKRLYILDGDSVRREPATLDEISTFIAGKTPRWSTEQLARVTLGDDGQIVATPLTSDEIKQLSAEIIDGRRAQLVQMLEHARSLCEYDRLEGVSVSLLGGLVSVWADEAPWAVDEVRTWATYHGLQVTEESPPADRKRWSPSMSVSVRGRDIVRVHFPSVELGETAVTAEIAGIAIANGMTSEAPF